MREYIERHADLLGDDVLEVGTHRDDPGAWWQINRDLARGAWLGIDARDGPGVDRVVDIHAPPSEFTGRFSCVLLSEVLEHVQRPWLALPLLRRCIRPGGSMIVTTLFAFPEHGYPDDYYRFSRQGLHTLLSDAGFTKVETEYAGEVEMELNDHGEPEIAHRFVPMHVFAVARC